MASLWPSVRACGAATVVDRTGVELVIRCERKHEHLGLHVARWLNGFISWEAKRPNAPERRP